MSTASCPVKLSKDRVNPGLSIGLLLLGLVLVLVVVVQVPVLVLVAVLLLIRVLVTRRALCKRPLAL